MTTKLTDDMLNDIISKLVQDYLDGFEEIMLEDRKIPLTEKKLEQLMSGYSDFKYDSKVALITGDYEYIRRGAEDSLQEQGVKDLDTDDFKKLCRELLKAQITVLGKIEDQIYGNYDAGHVVISNSQPGGSEQSPPLRTDTIQQAVSDYWDEYGRDLKVRT